MSMDGIFKRKVDVAISIIVAVLVVVSIVLNGFSMRIIKRLLHSISFVNPTLNIIIIVS